VNRQRAIEIMRFLSEKDMKTIIAQLNDGGEILKNKK
jgi:hypothetical protein